jgi:hypothetical protein
MVSARRFAAPWGYGTDSGGGGGSGKLVGSHVRTPRGAQRGECPCCRVRAKPGVYIVCMYACTYVCMYLCVYVCIYISQVGAIVALFSQCTRALTFENFCLKKQKNKAHGRNGDERWRGRGRVCALAALKGWARGKVLCLQLCPRHFEARKGACFKLLVLHPLASKMRTHATKA